MTFELSTAWSDLCLSCCGSTGRMLHGMCRYAMAVYLGEQIVAHGPLVIFFLLLFPQQMDFEISCK